MTARMIARTNEMAYLSFVRPVVIFDLADGDGE
jgi:hypothetical protein